MKPSYATQKTFNKEKPPLCIYNCPAVLLKKGRELKNIADFKKLTNQQAAIASIGQLALAEASISDLMDNVVKVVSETLGVEYCGIFESTSNNRGLLLKNAVGWKKGLIGKIISNDGKTPSLLSHMIVDNPEHLNQSKNLLLKDKHLLSGVSVQIQGENVPFGALELYSTKERVFSEEDVDFLQSIANVLAISIERKKSEDMQNFLVNASSILSTSLDSEITLAMLARLSIPILGDWCFVDILEGGIMRRVAVEHINPALKQLAQEIVLYPPNPNRECPAAQVLRTGLPVLITEITKSTLESIATNSYHLKLLKLLNPHSLIVSPLTARGRTLGTITFLSTESGKSFGSRDLSLAQDLARRAALAIDNGRLFKEAQEDIQERKKIEEILGFQKALLESQSEALPDGVLVVSLDRQILSYNQKFQNMWGLTNKIMYERSSELAANVISSKLINPQEFLSKLSYIYSHPSKEIGDELSLKDGRIFDRRSAPIKDISGACYGRVWFFRDVTERKKLQQQKDDFMAMASHELKTPVTSIKAFTQILQRRLSSLSSSELHSEPLHYLEKIDNQVNKLTHLVADLLDVSKIESGKLSLNQERFDLAQLVKEVADDLKQTTDKHKIIVSAKPKLFIYGDADRIEQVITNLMLNAIKYSPSANKIIIKIADRKKDAQVSVKDFGAGIPKKYHSQIFERFFQGIGPKKETYPGLGLGLYISKEIITRHEGKIWVKSKKGKGSTFFFSLPLQRRRKQ